MQEISSEYLKSLTGRVVRVYKGGPESKWGTLLAVNGDHLVIQTEKDGVIYYNVRHIKSISEDSKSTMLPPNDSEQNNVQHFNTTSFNALIEMLKGQYVRLDQGGPESRRGRVINLGKDHLVMETEQEGVLYYNLEHIKSISLVVNNNAKNDDSDSDKQNDNMMAMVNRPLPNYLEAGDFKQLLQTIGSQPHWVKINRGGPESMEGVLIPSNNSDDYLTLIINHEVIRISTFHIRNISIGQKAKQNNNQENNNQQNQSSNNQNQSSQQNSNSNNSDNKQQSRSSTKEARYVTFSSKAN